MNLDATELTYAPKVRNQLVYPHCAPVYWRNPYWTGLVKEKVEAAILAWADHTKRSHGEAIAEPSPEHLPVLRDYLVYHIHAPVWDKNPFANKAMLQKLRDLAKTVDSWQAVDRYLDQAGENYDPF